jgi:hypothetical protein
MVNNTIEYNNHKFKSGSDVLSKDDNIKMTIADVLVDIDSNWVTLRCVWHNKHRHPMERYISISDVELLRY